MARPRLHSLFRFAPILVAVLALATPAFSAELGGTAWQVGGNFKVKLRGVTTGPTSLSGVLRFDGLATDLAGTCALDLADATSGASLGTVPCSYSTARGRSFRVTFDPVAFDAALGGLIEALLPGASATVTPEPASGVMAPRNTRVTLRMKVVTAVAVPPGKGAKLKTDLLLTGKPYVPQP